MLSANGRIDTVGVALCVCDDDGMKEDIADGNGDDEVEGRGPDGDTVPVIAVVGCVSVDDDTRLKVPSCECVLDSVSVDITVSLGEGADDAVRVTEPVSLCVCVCECDGVALVVADGVALTNRRGWRQRATRALRW